MVEFLLGLKEVDVNITSIHDVHYLIKFLRNFEFDFKIAIH